MRSLEQLQADAERNPSDAVRWLRLAVALLRSDDPGLELAAVAALLHALSLEPGDPQICVSLGKLCLAVNMLDEARDAFERACTLDPSFVDAFTSLADVLIQLGEPGEALAELEQAQQIDGAPQAVLHLLRAVAFRAVGHETEAVAETGRALHHDPRNAQALTLRAELQTALGDHHVAASSWLRVAAAAPDDPAPRLHVADALIACGDASRAVNVLEEAAQAFPRLPGLHLRLAQAHAMAGSHDAALLAAEQATQLDPTCGPARIALAHSLERLGLLDKAAEAYEAASQIDPENVEALCGLGSVMTQRGDNKRARAALFRAAAIAPNNRQVESALAQLRATTRRPAETDATFRGQLSDFPVADCLEFLRSQRATGVLTVKGKKATSEFHFGSGRIVRAQCSKGSRLGAWLLADGAIQHDRLRACLAAQTGPSHRLLGEILLENQIVDESTLTKAIRNQMRQALEAILESRDGTFAFRKSEGVPDPPGMSADPQGLLLDILRVQDELAR